jgi:hypothetical protein
MTHAGGRNSRQLRVLAQIGAGKVEELITQTYTGNHEKMKLAVDNIAVALQELQKEMAQLTEASHEGQLAEHGKLGWFQGARSHNRLFCMPSPSEQLIRLPPVAGKIRIWASSISN